MSASSVKKISKRVLQIGLPIVILAVFLYQLKKNWTQLTAHTFQWNPWLLALACILALLIVLHPRVLNGLLNLALRLLKRDPVQLTLRYNDILLITLAWCASWFVAGCAFYILMLALWPDAPFVALPICIGIYALAWDIGFVSFITPSGLGVREAAIVGLFALALPLPVGLATVLALLSRFVSTIAEVVCVSIAYLSGGKQVLKIGKGTQPRLLKEDTNGGKQESRMLSAEIPESVSAEGGVMGE